MTVYLKPAQVADRIEEALQNAKRREKYARVKAQKDFHKGTAFGITRLALKLGWDCKCDTRKMSAKRFCYCRRK